MEKKGSSFLNRLLMHLLHRVLENERVELDDAELARKIFLSLQQAHARNVLVHGPTVQDHAIVQFDQAV